MYSTASRKHRIKHRSRGDSSSPFQTFLICRRAGLKLALCGALLAGSIILKLLSPAAYLTTCEYLTGSVNLKAAFSAIGKGIGGERKMTEALADAYRYAFVTDTDAQRND